MSNSKKKHFIIWACLISVLILLLSLEVFARVKYYCYVLPSQRKILYLELGDKARDFIDFDFEKHKGGMQYYDYHLYAIAPHQSKVATFTSYYSARNVPNSCPLGKGDMILWLFGGSTMQNLETIDKFTIANSIALGLGKHKIKATVFNFGVGGFQSSLESIKFQDLLRRTNLSERPNMVIFYDGFNDAAYAYLSGAGNMQMDLSRKIEALVTGHNAKLFVYSASNILSEFSYLWRDHMKLRIDAALFADHIKHPDTQDLARGVEMYVQNTRMIRSIAKEFNIKPIFILQPMIYTKKNLTSYEISVKKGLDQKQLAFMEEFYVMVRQQMLGRDDFKDLSDILDNSKRNDFTDLGHTGPYTGVDTGSHIAQIITSQLEKK